MLKVVLNDLLVNLKKRWVEVTIDIAFYIWAAYYISYFISMVGNPNVDPNFTKVNLEQGLLVKILTVVSIIAFLDLYSLMKRIPLRLNKAMFVCAAGEREKIKYILLQLAVKIIFSFIFIFIFSYYCSGSIFISDNFIINSIQIILWFFIILNINLKIGIGEKEVKKKDKEGYVIITKEEEIVNVYWFCLLIVEAIAFYSLVNLNINFNLFIILGWLIAFAINTFVAYKYMRPILSKSLSYEEVYRQEPERNEGY